MFSSVVCEFFLTISDMFRDNFKIFQSKSLFAHRLVNVVKEVLN